MKVIYAKSVREKIDDAIADAENTGRRIDVIVLLTTEMIDLHKQIGGPVPINDWFAMKSWYYRGVRLRLPESDDDLDV